MPTTGTSTSAIPSVTTSFSMASCSTPIREIIDPEGDLLIALQPAAEPFAEWETTTSSDPPADLTVPQEFYQQEDTEFLVSSKHLCLASPRFRKMLTGDWLEAKPIYPDGRRHVSMEGFCVDALMTVMNVIHGINKNKIDVPRAVSLNKLGKCWWTTYSAKRRSPSSPRSGSRSWKAASRRPTTKIFASGSSYPTSSDRSRCSSGSHVRRSSTAMLRSRHWACRFERR